MDCSNTWTTVQQSIIEGKARNSLGITTSYYFETEI